MAVQFSDSNLGRVTFKRATEFGVAPAPYDDAQIARVTSSSLAATKETAVSDELRADRMVADLIETAFTSGGDWGFELSLGGTWDDFLEALLAGTYQALIGLTAGNFTVTAATQKVADADAGGTAFVNAKPGNYLYARGFANAGNNGWHRIVSVDSNDAVTVATPVATLTDETTAGGTTYVAGKTLRNPGDPTNIVKRDYALTQYFSDIDVAQLFLGQRLGTLSLTTAANAIVTGTWTFQGASVQAQESAGDYPSSTLPPVDTDVVGATANVANVEVNGQPSSCLVQSIDLTVDNTLRDQNAVQSKFPCQIGYGRQTINGTLTSYFQDLTIYNAFLQHTDLSLAWGYEDSAGNALHIYLPRIKIATDTPGLEGIDTDVLENMDYQALAFDPGGGDDAYQIQITVANADGS